MSESQPYTPEEAFSEGSQISERLHSKYPEQAGNFSHAMYESENQSIEQSEKNIKENCSNLFGLIVSKYEDIANLGLDFEIFYKSLLSLIASGDYRPIAGMIRRVGGNKLEDKKTERLSFCERFNCDMDSFSDLQWLVKTLFLFIERSRKLVDFESSISSNENFSLPTLSINDDGINAELGIREKILAQCGLCWDPDGSQHEDINLRIPIGARTSGKEFSNSNEDPETYAYNEQEVVYAGIILSPSLSTEQFLAKVKDANAGLGNLFPDDYREARLNKNGIYLFNSFWNAISQYLLSGNRVFEVGGRNAAQGFTQLGAVEAKTSDAGHSGYHSAFYNTGNNMIELSNFGEFCDPHSVDIVCSSRLFDMGSGIGKISEPSNSSQQPDHLGEREMMLVMTNTLKDGGFMIHFNSPLSSATQGTGVTSLGRVASGAEIYRYHQEDITAPNDFHVGKKHVVYNPETKTFERSN